MVSFLSPRVAALDQALEARQNEALDQFWQEIARHGSPLIELAEENPEERLVTFLWRDTAGTTRNVVLLGGLAVLWDLPNAQLTRLRETDLWYKTLRARADTRTTYRLIPNDSLLPPEDETDWEACLARCQVDPLNPRLFVAPPDPEHPKSQEHRVSILELDAAPAQPWIEPQVGVAAGTLHQHTFASALLQNERRLWVYIPPGYTREAAPYPLLLLFDGREYAGRCVPTATILDNLLAAGRIPPLVALLLDNAGGDSRERELGCSEQFNQFLTQEVLPWARQHYHFTTNPAETIIGGSSLGGTAGAFAAFHHPEVFGAVLSQSGAFWWKAEGDEEYETVARTFARHPRLPLRFYLEVGLLERSVIRDDMPGQIVANRHLRTLLQAKGYPVHYAEFMGWHHYVCWRGSLADGLLALIGRDMDNTRGTG
jgi:enterochelin esterase family protein